MKKYFVTGIGTDIGKTIVSAILCEALEADYWKPVQSGSLDHTDSDEIRDLISNSKSRIFPEAYRLPSPLSPHASAERAGIQIHAEKIMLPETSNTLVIEGAGGLMVPLNHQTLLIDLLSVLKAEIILVSRNYLGSINHTLLSWEALKKRQLPVYGIVFNGEANPETEEFILEYTRLPLLGRVPLVEKPDKTFVIEQSLNFRNTFL